MISRTEAIWLATLLAFGPAAAVSGALIAAGARNADPATVAPGADGAFIVLLLAPIWAVIEIGFALWIKPRSWQRSVGRGVVVIPAMAASFLLTGFIIERLRF